MSVSGTISTMGVQSLPNTRSENIHLNRYASCCGLLRASFRRFIPVIFGRRYPKCAGRRNSRHRRCCRCRYSSPRADKEQSGRVRSTTVPVMCAAMIRSGATPRSTQFSKGPSISKLFGRGPPPQWCTPGAMRVWRTAAYPHREFRLCRGSIEPCEQAWPQDRPSRST